MIDAAILSRAVAALRLRFGSAALYREVRKQTKADCPQRSARWRLMVEAARLMEREKCSRWNAALTAAGGQDAVARDVVKHLRADPDRYAYQARIADIADLLTNGRRGIHALTAEPVTNFLADLHARAYSDEVKDAIHRDVADHLLDHLDAIAMDKLPSSPLAAVAALDDLLKDLRK